MQCGEALDPDALKGCPSCAAPVGEWQSFCISCGAPMAPTGAGDAGLDQASPGMPSGSTITRGVTCPSCGRPTGTATETCRWCGGDLTEVRRQVRTTVKGSAESPSSKWKTRRTAVLIGVLLLITTLTILPWVLFSGGASARPVLLNPSSGGTIERRVGEAVQIQGMILGGRGTGEAAILIDGAEVWSQVYEDSLPPIASATWTSDAEGEFEVTLLIELEDGSEVTDTASVQVSERAQ